MVGRGSPLALLCRRRQYSKASGSRSVNRDEEEEEVDEVIVVGLVVLN